MQVNEYGCPFCNEFCGRKERSYFAVMYGSNYGIPERRILETEHFACVPSLGSFVEGYVLVVPKEHFLSALMMPERYFSELSGIFRALSAFYAEQYQQGFLIYEHGTADARNVGGMSVVHAHLHAVPCGVPVISLLSEFAFLPFDDISAARAYYLEHQAQPYLLLKDIDHRLYLAVSDQIPSQYFRKKVCAVCGKAGTWDWKQYPYLENVKRTLAAAEAFGIKKLLYDCEEVLWKPSC